jgi:hypothetical protein
MVCSNFEPSIQSQMTTAGRSDRLVMRWLQIGIVMTIFQIALGGITRLTGSGLSITEWEVITGVLPPLNHEEWVAAFEAYRKTPQYQLLNRVVAGKTFQKINGNPPTHTFCIGWSSRGYRLDHG